MEGWNSQTLKESIYTYVVILVLMEGWNSQETLNLTKTAVVILVLMEGWNSFKYEDDDDGML